MFMLQAWHVMYKFVALDVRSLFERFCSYSEEARVRLLIELKCQSHQN